MEKFELSVKRFDEFAGEYAQRFADVSGYADSIGFFCDSVNSNSPHILELACGPGNVTRMLKNRVPESRILGIDLAPKMIEIAQKALPNEDFRVMDVRDISAISEKFDAVMCSFCLPFLSKADAAKLIVDCANRLVPGGVIYLSTMEGDENRAGFETTSFSGNAEIYFNYHIQTDLTEAFVKNGFNLVRVKRQDYIEPDESITTDLIFIGIKSS